ncbi:hypothetical protein DRQ53_04800 [bacterium]|nr:MAG: hypothetical protein DRQ32_03740 [bacterium]RKZ16992.1 MAG: hypothetical protein DRQ53_04800 [bacterium]
MSDELRWAEERVVAFALGALDDEDERRIRGILEGQDAYASLLEPPERDGIGHVPAALLARWTDAGRRLRGIERELVLEHVQRCDSCRDELEMLGLSPQSWLTAVDEPVSRGARAWLPWVGGAALGAAAALVLVMGIPRGEAPAIHGIELAVVTPGTLRGTASTVLVVSPDATAFILATPLPSDVEAGVTPLLVVIDPAGQRIAETRLAAAPWSPPSTQLVLVDQDGFAEGEYRVILEIVREPDPWVLGAFRVQHSH